MRYYQVVGFKDYYMTDMNFCKLEIREVGQCNQEL